LPICSGLDNVCTDVSNVVYNLSISLVSESLTNNDFTSNLFSFFADVKVLPNTPFDMIIGKRTIKKYILPLVLPSQFFDDDCVGDIQSTTHSLLPRAKLLHGLVSGERDNRGQAPCEAQPCVGCGNRSCGGGTDSALQPELEYASTEDVRIGPVSGTHTVWTEGEQLDRDEGCYPLPLQAPAQTHDTLINSLVRETQDLFAAIHNTDDEIDDDKVDSFAPFLVVDKIVGRNDYFSLCLARSQ
jgi:hypothetical protein